MSTDELLETVLERAMAAWSLMRDHSDEEIGAHRVLLTNFVRHQILLGHTDAKSLVVEGLAFLRSHADRSKAGR